MATCAICLEAEGEGEEVREGEERRSEDEKKYASINCCSHRFCYDCIVGWARRRKTCPVCRASISSITVTSKHTQETRTLSVFDALMEKFGGLHSDDDEDDEEEMFDGYDDDSEASLFFPLPFAFFHHMYPMLGYDTDDSFVVTDEDLDEELEEDSEHEDEDSEAEIGGFVPPPQQLEVLSAIMEQQRRRRAMQDLEQRIQSIRERTTASTGNVQQNNSSASQPNGWGSRSNPICIDEPSHEGASAANL